MISSLKLHWTSITVGENILLQKGSSCIQSFSVSFSTFLMHFPSFPFFSLQVFCRNSDCSVPYAFTHHLLNLAGTLNQFLMLAALLSLAFSASLRFHFISLFFFFFLVYGMFLSLNNKQNTSPIHHSQ